MKKNIIMHKFMTGILAVILPVSGIHAEICPPHYGDSIQTCGVEFRTEDEFKFNAKQLILPGLLIAAGSLGVSDKGWFHKKINLRVRDGIQNWRKDRRFKADDYIQYLPLAAHLGLSACGVKAKTTYKERIAVMVTSYAALGIMVNGIKYASGKSRPDGSKKNSFVSGHTATVFMGAELVRTEYKDASPWYGVGAYTVATGVGFLRLYNNHHWVSDVVAGAGVGILSARIGYWLLPFERKLFGWDGKGKRTLVAVPYYQPDTKSAGASFSMVF